METENLQPTKNPRWVKVITHIMIICIIIDAVVVIVLRHGINVAVVNALTAFAVLLIVVLSMFAYRIDTDKFHIDERLKSIMTMVLLQQLGITIVLIYWLISVFGGAIFLIKKRGGNSRLRIG